MPRFERSGLEHRIQLPALPRQDVQHGGDGNGAVADGAAHEAIALVGELNAVVLKMHMPHVRSDAADEIERRLGDEEDARTLWERGEDAAIADYELTMIRRSARNMRAIGLGVEKGI